MDINESLTKADQTAQLLESEIIEAIKLACPQRPEGHSRGDRAIREVLNRVLAEVRSVRNDLAILD